MSSVRRKKFADAACRSTIAGICAMRAPRAHDARDGTQVRARERVRHHERAAAHVKLAVLLVIVRNRKNLHISRVDRQPVSIPAARAVVVGERRARVERRSHGETRLGSLQGEGTHRGAKRNGRGADKEK